MCAHSCVRARACMGVHVVCLLAGRGRGRDRLTEEGREKPREIEERSDEGREAEYKHLPLVPLFCGNRPRRLPFGKDEAKKNAVSLEH